MSTDQPNDSPKPPPRTRRARGDGSITQRKDGRWSAILELDRGEDGKRRRLQHYAGSRREAAAWLKDALRDRDAGRLAAKKPPLLKDHLNAWLAQIVVPFLRDCTSLQYESTVRVHLIPAFGHLPVPDLTTRAVQTFLNEKSAAGLAPGTVRMLKQCLNGAYKAAIRWEITDRNPTRGVTLPKMKPAAPHVFTEPEARAFLAAVQGDRMEAIYTVAMAVGLRRGEALGLRWSDVDLDAATLRVEQAVCVGRKGLQVQGLKTPASRRTFSLPAVAVAALRRHRARQQQERLLAGPGAWQDSGLVFTTRTGGPVHPSTLNRWFKRTLQRAGLPHQRFHDLRHACATLLLAQGVPARVVMDLLGHSGIAITLNLYSHVLPAMRSAAADAMDRALSGAPAADDKAKKLRDLAV